MWLWSSPMVVVTAVAREVSLNGCEGLATVAREVSLNGCEGIAAAEEEVAETIRKGGGGREGQWRVVRVWDDDGNGYERYDRVSDAAGGGGWSFAFMVAPDPLIVKNRGRGGIESKRKKKLL